MNSKYPGDGRADSRLLRDDEGADSAILRRLVGLSERGHLTTLFTILNIMRRAALLVEGNRGRERERFSSLSKEC